MDTDLVKKATIEIARIRRDLKAVQVRVRAGATRRDRRVDLVQVRAGATATTILQDRAAGRGQIGRIRRGRVAGRALRPIIGATATDAGAIATGIGATAIGVTVTDAGVIATDIGAIVTGAGTIVGPA